MAIVTASETALRDEDGKLQVPEGFELSAEFDVTVDGEAASLTRYERSAARNAGLMGEHFSMVINSQGMLKGFTRMDQKLAGGELPSRDRAREVALTFLADQAPDLLEDMDISWIEPHDETIRVQQNGMTGDLTLTGMKVKCRNMSDGKWFWVIVGAHDTVMTFERDIVWITMPGHRQTEKWLHDSWLKENGHQLRPVSVAGSDGTETLRSIAPEGASIPGISPAMLVDNGRLLFLSGHVPLNAHGEVAGPDVETQLEQAFENLMATLRAAGGDKAALARLTLYIRDYTPDLLPKIRAIRDRYINLARPPASALIGVAALFHPDVLVEVDAVAVLPPQ